MSHGQRRTLRPLTALAMGLPLFLLGPMSAGVLVASCFFSSFCLSTPARAISLSLQGTSKKACRNWVGIAKFSGGRISIDVAAAASRTLFVCCCDAPTPSPSTTPPPLLCLTEKPTETGLR